MALPANKKTGTANVGISAVYFLKHLNGVEPEVNQTLVDSTDWFPVLTRRGTVSVSQDNPSMTKVLVDQFDAPIGMDVEPGDFTIEAQMPSLTQEDLEKWLGNELEVVKDSGTPVTIDGKQLLGFNLDGHLYEMSVLVKTKKGSSILFTNVQLSFLFSYDDNVFQTKIAGQVLAAQREGNKMVYVATEPVVAVTGITLNKSTTSIVKDETETLVATIAPANATDKGVTWTSSDEAKATVDENGVVTAKATGSATITATANGDSTKTATCTVTVTAS